MSNSQDFEDIVNKFASIGLNIPRILLPSNFIDIHKWAVVACDQYTSDHAYWHEVDQAVGDSASSLRITLPEIFLEAADVEERIKKIHDHMKEYLDKKLVVDHGPALVYVERTTEASGLRQGLMVAVDLEYYDYSPDSKTLIRATEGTIVERIPPRLRVRKEADIEIPHIMILINDPQETVIEPLKELCSKLSPAYALELMKHGGKLKGFILSDADALKQIANALHQLLAQTKQNQNSNSPLFFAMGDGNHSLATAKAHWQALKLELSEQNLSEEAIMKHPARYALAEIVNIHSKGLRFEPIHRAIFSKNPSQFVKFVKASNLIKKLEPIAEADAKKLLVSEKGSQSAVIFDGKEYLELNFVNNKLLPPAQIDALFKEYLSSTDGAAKIDFIHGWEDCTKLVDESAIACLVPVIARDELFAWVAQKGPLPRKAFSMGEAEEKRYYLEARRITI